MKYEGKRLKQWSVQWTEKTGEEKMMQNLEKGKRKSGCNMREKKETVVGAVVRKDGEYGREMMEKALRVLRVRDKGRQVLLRLTLIPPHGGANTAVQQDPPKPRSVVLDKAHFQNVTELDVSDNGITSLDVSCLSALASLTCCNNALTSLTLHAAALIHLSATNNR
ncbi:hypothetical protein E2C01_017898 [Portunus trituberculatus]|uniref:Uncharacterized protein n=1 Tax=Portunus trituberculatus TaxID=210409 RepID=A0A5B7DV95_PORTR|nr:hypothetical protein [Portunus trituberculatus]